MGGELKEVRFYGEFSSGIKFPSNYVMGGGIVEINPIKHTEKLSHYRPLGVRRKQKQGTKQLKKSEGK